MRTPSSCSPGDVPRCEASSSRALQSCARAALSCQPTNRVRRSGRAEHLQSEKGHHAKHELKLAGPSGCRQFFFAPSTAYRAARRVGIVECLQSPRPSRSSIESHLHRRSLRMTNASHRSRPEAPPYLAGESSGAPEAYHMVVTTLPRGKPRSQVQRRLPCWFPEARSARCGSPKRPHPAARPPGSRDASSTVRISTVSIYGDIARGGTR
jgi:hypothetical protein